MHITVFDTHSYDRKSFAEHNGAFGHELRYLDCKLHLDTALLASGSQGVCLFVNDQVDLPVLTKLSELGVQAIFLRCAGFNNVDLMTCERLGLRVFRVPEYSPHAVAEHAMALLLSLNRHIHRAYNRVRDGNFSIQGLEGFDLHRKTIGIIGYGKIGKIFAQLGIGFGCEVLVYDPGIASIEQPSVTQATSLRELLQKLDIISLHCPLTPKTKHILNQNSIALMKPTSIIINTGRGALIDTAALIDALKFGRIGGAGLDVYEEEAELFFEDHSNEVIRDDELARLITFPNVIITSHQAFLTREALSEIATTVLRVASEYESGKYQSFTPPEECRRS